MTAEYRGPQMFEDWAESRDLKIFHRVVSINLAGQKFDDETLALMKKLRFLKEASLYDTSVSGEGMADLERALPELRLTVIVPAEIHERPIPSQ